MVIHSDSGSRRSSPSPSISVAGDNEAEESAAEISGARWLLDSIIMENFKSYKGQVKVGPLRPFVAVIGANGSGKSNLMDAISFVMGERTSTLRARRLTELVHGASIGKPVATQASVKANFKVDSAASADVGNEKEISFERIIRGTSSEYKINEEVVNPQKYLDKLKELGINPKGKNFLVFQGAIESIAMKDAKERCVLLEEICGSAVLKDDYEKLKEELQKLERKVEVAYMRKKSVAVERKEAKAEVLEAQQYGDLLQEQSEKETRLNLFRLYHMEEDLTMKESDVIKKESDANRLENAKHKFEDNIKEQKKKYGEINRVLTAHDSELAVVDREKIKKRPKLIELEQRRKHLEKKQAGAEKSLKNAQENMKCQQHDLSELENKFKKVREKEKAFLEDHAELQLSQGVDVTLRESQVEEYRSLKTQVISSTQKERRELEQLQRKMKDANNIFASLSREKTELENNLELVVDEIGEKTKLGKKCFEAREETQGSLKRKAKELKPFKKMILDAEENVQKYRQKLDEVSTEIENIRIDRHETTRIREKREVIDALQTYYKGVWGRVATLCKPRHSRFKVAITKIMGKHMDAIVVDSEKTARDCIQYLKEQLKAPEVFLPLDLLRVKPLRERFREKQGKQNTCLAYDAVEFNPEIEKAALYCVNSNVICESPELAKRVAAGEIFGEPANAVSLDGTFYSTSGVLSGGKADLQRKAKRWDDNELAKKEKERLEIQEKLRDVVKISRKRFDLDVFEQEISGIKQLLKSTEENFSIHIAAAKELEKKKEDIEKQLEEISGRWIETGAATSEVTNEVKNLKKRINVVEDKFFKNFCQDLKIPNIRAYEDTDVREQEDFNRQKEDFQQQIRELELKIKFEKEQQLEVMENIKRWEKILNEVRSKLSSCKAEEDVIQAEMREINDKFSAIEAEIKSTKAQSDAISEEIKEASKKVDVANKELHRHKKASSSLRSSIMKIKMKRHDLFKHCKLAGINIPLIRGAFDDLHIISSEPSLNASDATLRALIEEDRVDIDYSILSLDLRQLSQSDVQGMDEEIEAQLRQLEIRISQIQAPNMKADQKWETIQKRAREQEAAFDEIRKEVKAARDVFEKIKKERFDKFMNCFQKVSRNIEKIYKALTQDESAQAILELDNPEEPYLDGISYHCVPPRKRYQPMSQLSGGEKTLAALALLFAIHSFEPAPFFVLDEIDAALDNTNIGKVSSYIQQSANDLQILVISLKPEFFENADVLLGVAPDIQDSECVCSNVYTLNLAEYER